MTLARGFLGLLGVAYCLVGIWCAVKPRETAKSIGFIELEPAGRSEYLAVYGGLQIGLGLVYLAAGLDSSAWPFGLKVCAITHLAMVVMRAASFATIGGLGSTTMLFTGLEITFALIGSVLWAVNGRMPTG